MVYYGVAKGKTRGVFEIWSECKKSIDGFNGAIFKKFDSKEDAEKFVTTGFINNNYLINKKTTVISNNKIKNEIKNKINFDSSDSESEIESNIKAKPKFKVNVLSRAEEEKIRNEINFDSTDSESEIESNIKDKKLDKLDLLISSENNSLEINYSEPFRPDIIAYTDKEYKKNQNLKALEDFKPDIIVYTDGSCFKNGYPDAQAGIGIYFGKDDSRNVSQKVIGTQTNNTAELTALIKAYEILEADILINKKIVLFTDSVYAILCVSTYGEKMAKIDWKKTIPNKDLVKKAYGLFSEKTNIKLVHIHSHTGLTDIHSLGNEEADKLANLAIGLVPKSISNKIYIEVPFSKKDIAKKLGCRWDANKKKWYIQEPNEEIYKQFSKSKINEI
jgi:ribonuclease HI